MADSQQIQDQALFDRLTECLKLSEELLFPVRRLIYLCNLHDAQRLLDQTRVKIAGMNLEADFREALGYDLRYHQCHISWHAEMDGWSHATYLEAIPAFQRPAVTPLGDTFRMSCLLKIQLSADEDGFETLSAEGVHGVVAGLPEPMVNQLRFKLSTWAFDHQNIEMLEMLFTMYLTNPPNRMGQAQWQRVNLMYQLLKGKATARDLQESIRTLELIPQVVDFLGRLWPAAEKAGLVTPELQADLDARIEEVYRKEDYPLPERRTKSFIKGAN